MENPLAAALRASVASTGHHDTEFGEEDVEIVEKEKVDEEKDAIIVHIFAFLVTVQDLENMAQVSKKWKELVDHPLLYQSQPSVNSDGSVNWGNFKNLGFKCKGTEGDSYKCLEKSSGKIFALKKTRVVPKVAGVPYYRLRELAVLKEMKHSHITPLKFVSLAKNELHMFFPYVENTLHDIMNPTGEPEQGRALSETVIRNLLHQLLDAVAYCHRRGVLHRNLKPQHLLIKTSDPVNLSNATLQISDFAFVRATGIPTRSYTNEVVTLWYRAPEILMGLLEYSQAVDMWSVGCIFAEMVKGSALFTGISEIDQLFQIFSKLSTPTSETWPDFTSLPNYHFEFPHWDRKPLCNLVPDISAVGIDLLTKLLVFNPGERITAEEALHHPYFFKDAPAYLPLTLKNVLDQMYLTIVQLWANPNPRLVESFHSYLREVELETWTAIEFLKRQASLQPSHRSMLVDWIAEVVDVFELSPRTAFLAVNYTDRYLDIKTVGKTQLQLLGATCLYVASKLEDVTYIGVEDLAMCAGKVYTTAEVLNTEEQMLNTLNFALSVPTAIDFLSIYEQMISPIQEKTSMLAHYLLELTLQEHQFLLYRPSVVAVCCLSMAMYTIDGYPMTTELAKACQYSWLDLQDATEELQTLFLKAPFSTLAVVKNRYSKPKRCEVAKVPPPVSFSKTFYM